MLAIIILIFQTINYDSLYDYAKTGLVKFNAEKDSARKVFINLGKEGIEYLAKKLDTKFSVESNALEEMLKRMGKPAIEGIIKNIDYRGSDEESRNLRTSLRIIGETFKSDSSLTGDDIVPAIARFVDDYDWRVRSAAATVLGYSRSRKALPHLLVGIKDSINIVRKSAAFGLKNISASEDIPLLLNIVSDDYYGVRFAAHEALIKIGVQAIDAIAQHLKQTEEPDVKSLLIRTLARIKDKKVLKIIKPYKEDPSVAVRLAVYEGNFDKKTLQKFLKIEKDPILQNYLKSKISE